LIANLLFIRVFVFVYSCFVRNYVMIFQSLSTRILPTTNYANDTNYIAISISVISEIRS